ncbi:MAG: hypothetical protein J0H17_15865 [Rhizobiales bacterium]|nr:hypothetical protein [Hyphomicrobiales bacterium]
MTMFDELRKPFPPERVSWRVGATKDNRGLALAYIDARDVMERLDEVCGPDGWQCRYPHANGKTVCEIGIQIPRRHVEKIDGANNTITQMEWVWKADGAGDTDVEAEKGALSDAFKRAAVRWGIGRYLYDIESVWVTIEQYGKSKVIAPSEMGRLAKLLGGKAPPPKPDNAALDSKALATDFMHEITLIATDPRKTKLDLQAWLKTKNLDPLTEPDYELVSAHYKASKANMKEREAA